MGKCKLAGIQVGTTINVDESGICLACGYPITRSGVNVIYRGHTANHRVYDALEHVSPAQCVNCGIDHALFGVPCEEGGSWEWAEVAAAMEVGDVLA